MEMNTTGMKFDIFHKPEIPEIQKKLSNVFAKGNFLLESIDAVSPARGTESPFNNLSSNKKRRRR